MLSKSHILAKQKEQEAQAAVQVQPVTSPQRLTAGQSNLDLLKGSFDFLSLVQQDTGEQGRLSGKCIHFDKCPICGHQDCFRFYPDNGSDVGGTFYCFGANGNIGGDAITYIEVTRKLDANEAIHHLKHDLCGIPKTGKLANDVMVTPLPPIRLLSEVKECPPPTRFAIPKIAPIRSVSVVTGNSGVGKTWIGGEAALSVASGTDFLGLECVQGDALFVNTEMPEDEMVRRLWMQREARGLSHDIPVHIITTAGSLASLQDIHDHIIAECNAMHIHPKLVFVDSLYLATSGADENTASDMTRQMLMLQSIATKLNAALVFAHHHPKGSSGSRSVLDRIVGSGAIGRFVSAHICLSALDAPVQVDSLNMTVRKPYRLEWGKSRYAAMPEPLDLWFNYPIFELDTTGELATYSELEGSTGSQKRQRAAEAKSNQLVNAISNHIAEHGEQPTRAQLASLLPVKPRTLVDHIKEAMKAGLIFEDRSTEPFRYSLPQE